MKRRVPRTLDEMVVLTGMEREKVERILQELSVIGIVELKAKEKDINYNMQAVSDSRELIEKLKEGIVDVLFLDIDMPYYSGMDIASYINEHMLSTIVVFVTSHDALVYKTFAYRPFGFLRKTHIAEEIDEFSYQIAI
jgi:DNA-binding LytR/AlgR family response regulator